MVSGVVKPFMLKPGPEMLAVLMTRLAPPVFVSFIVCEFVVPVMTVPKFTGFGTTASCGGFTPVPESEIIAGEPLALLVRVTLPVTFPVPVGANFTENELFCPGVKVSGVERPLRLNPAPEAIA